MDKITKVISALHLFLERGNDVLKPRQKEIILAIIQAFGMGHRAIYIEAPTGLGKTVITSQLLRALSGSGKLPRILVVTPSIKLVEDAGKKFKEFAPELHTGMYYTYAKNDAPITISTYASFPRLAETHAKKYDLIILDEGHHILSKRLLEHLQKFKGAFWLAMTATPGFSPQRHLNQHFYLAHRTTIHEAIDMDLISGYRNILVYAKAVNLDVPVAQHGDFSASALERAVNINVRNMAAIDFYRHSTDPATGERLLGRKAIFNCVGIDHARDVARLLCETIPASAIGGRIPCAAIHGDMYRKDIKETLSAHKAGKILCLTQAKMLGEGHDDPGIKLVINLKPSLSMVEVPQRGGRALRISTDNPDTSALIVDFIDEGTLNRKLPFLFSEITGSPAYGKWLSTKIKRRQHDDVFSVDMAAEKIKRAATRYFRISELDVIWSPEQITEIVKKRQIDRIADTNIEIYPVKDVEWLSAEEVASYYNVPVLLVLKTIRHCRTHRLKPGIRIDQQKKIEWRIERRSVRHTHMECLHASQLTAFGKIYGLDIPPKTDDWLTCGEIAEQLMRNGLRRVDGSTVSSAFARLKIVKDADDLRYDQQTGKKWRMGKRRHKTKKIICLHQDDFDEFCKEYHLDALEQSKEFLSPSEIYAAMEQETRSWLSQIEKYLKSCLGQSNMMGEHLSYAVEYRYVSGRPLPCLRRNAFPAFVAFQRAEAERRNAEQQAYALKYREERRKKRLNYI